MDRKRNPGISESLAKPHYPRPQLVRPQWRSLNGRWDFALDPEARWRLPRQVRWDRRILVPFAPETRKSGVRETGYFHACWYRRTFSRPKLGRNQRVILYFGAVDYSAQVWMNGKLVVSHEGGYTPFSADITEHLTHGKQEVIVRAQDDPRDRHKPRGKQDWQPEPHEIWYYRTTGIWQTVWLEVVPATHIARLRWTPSLQKWQMGLLVELAGAKRDDLRLRVKLRQKNRTLVEDSQEIKDGTASLTLKLPKAKAPSARRRMLWSVEAPNLIDAELKLVDRSGSVTDRVESYTALRSVAVKNRRFLLNDKPTYLRMALDQGYWRESGLSAPNDRALRRDVELAKAMGFNGVRKHQKIEDPRFLYWADRLGLLVWEEMPSAYFFSERTVQRVSTQWIEVVRRDANHPCIITWMAFNESWGVPELAKSQEQKRFVEGLAHLTRALDPTRPVIGNDGWEMIANDIIGIHDYEKSPERLRERWAPGAKQVGKVLAREQPARRKLLLEGQQYQGLPVMITEFGGIAFSREKRSWGYKRAETAQDLARQYEELLDAIHSLKWLAGFCYTQLTDTYQEANGLLRMDRKPKIPIGRIARATRGK